MANMPVGVQGGGVRTSQDVGSKIQGGLRQGFGAIGGFVNGLGSINRFKLAAILVWFIGVYSTSVVMQAGSGVGFNPNSLLDNITIGIYASQLFGAFVVQIIFTTIEAPIFNRQGANPLSLFVVILDTIINSIVVWPLARGFVGSEAWMFLNFALETITGTFNNGVGYSFGSGDIVIVFLTLFGGVSIAAAPEMLWSWGSKTKGG